MADKGGSFMQMHRTNFEPMLEWTLIDLNKIIEQRTQILNRNTISVTHQLPASKSNKSHPTIVRLKRAKEGEKMLEKPTKGLSAER